MNNDEKDHSKKIIILIILVIIILSLITSCGCTSRFFGKLGGPLLDGINNAFNNEEDHTINNSTNDREIISNRELKFDVSHTEIILGTPKTKISYTYSSINPQKFTCSTSDANIATCYVDNGYVVINTKSTGTVNVILQTTVNGKIYEASTSVTIVDDIEHADEPPYSNESDNNISNNTSNNNSSSSNNNTNSTKNNNYLKSIDVLNSGYKLNEKFEINKNNYSMTVAYNEKNLSLSATLYNTDSSISYKLNNISINDLNNLPLEEGNNTLEIIVKSKQGDINTYVVNIYKPIRTIKFEYSSYSIYLGSTYNINYIIEEDGKSLTSDAYDINDISAKLSQYESDCLIKVNKGYITLTPNVSIGGKDVELTLSYNGKNSETKLSFIKYDLYTYQQIYDMSFTNNHGERTIILNTNLFLQQEVKTYTSNDKKQISICTNDNNLCVNISVDSLEDSGNIELEYIGENDTPSSLPFKIVANSVGNSTIHVSGDAYGIQIANFDIEIKVGQKYNVIINANGGLFNEFEEQYEFLISSSEEINLSDYDEPYKMDSECNMYKFIGYSTTPNGEIQYNTTDKNIIKNLNEDLTLYAIYETNSTPIEEEIINKTLWLTDVSLFHNEEYYKKYKEDKVIYPGAYGVYVMNLKNNSSSKVTITGLTLKENTICIDDKGCLNMGYIIKYSASESNDWTYYYGETDSKYWILNSNSNTVKESDEVFKSEISFSDAEKIDIEPNETIAISIFWKWEEVDNELDTLIGNQAAKKLYDASINDMYGISVGISFETKLESCKN